MASRREVTRPRPLARTLTRARWSEYDTLLRVALELGWVPMDLERWIVSGGVQGRVLILRHDVDQHPAAAIKMARIDARHGVRATWYFRWRTCSPAAVAKVAELGGGIGFHYETLTRVALERKLTAADVDAQLVAGARAELEQEVAAFKRRFGRVQSVSAHGDTRALGISNQILMRGEDPRRFGVDFDANEALARHRLGRWMTDRSAAEGGWEHGADALTVLRESSDPILCLTHPNNWCSGPSLWSDRIRAAILPTPPLEAARWRVGIRTRSDRPPGDQRLLAASAPIVAAPALRAAAPVRPFAPVSVSLRREILRHYYDSGRSLTSEAGLRTLETNSGLAEVRASTLEQVLTCAHLSSLRGRKLLDLGCGFGALALVFATRGAQVTALDPNSDRLEVGARVAAEHGLGIAWRVGEMGTTPLGREEFEVVIMNNSFCYVVELSARRAALQNVWRALAPGGVLVIRSPNRVRLQDQFTRLPLVGLLPPAGAATLSRALGRNRSHVRLLSNVAARRELRRAGFVAVESVEPTERGRLLAPFASYQHLIARRPIQ